MKGALRRVASDATASMRAELGDGLRGDIQVPGDKSMSHRALILGALAAGETEIEGLLEGDDVLRTARALSAFGVPIVRAGPGRWQVSGRPWRSPSAPLDCGNSGTGARLLMGAAAGMPITATFCGDESLQRRPMQRVTDPLRQMGAAIRGGDRLPVQLCGGGLRGIRHRSPVASAQVKSAILLAGLSADGPIEVIEPTPSRDHTERMLSSFGCAIESQATREGWSVRLGRSRDPSGTRIGIPGDPSSAAFPLVAALLVPNSSVTVRGMMLNPLRTGLFETLSEMGAQLRIANRRTVSGEDIADISVRTSRLSGVRVPAARAPSMIDEYPILAVAAAMAEGDTTMCGLAELRVKESDRLGAMLDGLRACGVAAHVDGDALVVRGSAAPIGGAMIESSGDHRIAMSFLVLGLTSKAPVTVNGAEMIATSFPGFAALMSCLGARLSQPGVT